MDGRRFISVLDLEDKALHQDLPACLSPGAQDVPSIRPSTPTSAQLHLLALSVIRNDAAADPPPVVTIPEDLDWRSHTGVYISLYTGFFLILNTISEAQHYGSKYVLHCTLQISLRSRHHSATFSAIVIQKESFNERWENYPTLKSVEP